MSRSVSTAPAYYAPPISAMFDALLRIEEVSEVLSISRSEIYRMIGRGTFPRPIKLSARASRWRRSEVQKWIETMGQKLAGA